MCKAKNNKTFIKKKLHNIRGNMKMNCLYNAIIGKKKNNITAIEQMKLLYM